ncbi:hypothetical protein SCHPADRAFT_947437 [Schizopora paradoxa]|uniref:Uncharacterized protein n=1 Tax=Schizopora paradoxa TaxID=27342 RepID=A0A0H2R5N3_9AGAM|nr:hypothetical protein SCHPADRAFT_947437 [Schizopora paradoxa]
MVAIKPIKVKKTHKKDAAILPIYTSPTKKEKTFTIFTTDAGTLQRSERTYIEETCDPKRTSCSEGIQPSTNSTQKVADGTQDTRKDPSSKNGKKSQVENITMIHKR